MSGNIDLGIPGEEWDKLPLEIRTSLLQLNLGAAQARHAAHRAELASADNQTWGAAHGTIRFLMALNAGAIVAILAFLGSMIESKASLWIAPLAASLILFLLGATLAVVASAIAFFAGSTLVEGLTSDELINIEPYVVGNDHSNGRIEMYNRLRLVGVSACLASGVAAVAGSASFLVFALHALAR